MSSAVRKSQTNFNLNSILATLPPGPATPEASEAGSPKNMKSRRSLKDLFSLGSSEKLGNPDARKES